MENATHKTRRIRLAKTFVQSLCKEAQCKGASQSVIDKASVATIRNLNLPQKLSVPMQIRAENYFWAVIRRASLQEKSSRCITGRYLLASVVADMQQAHCSNEKILSELEQVWATRVPFEVMNEFRARLASISLAS